MKKNNWAAIRAEYITTDISYEQLAKKYGVTKTAIWKHAKPEKWVEERTKYISKKNEEVVKRVENKDIKNTVSRIERINALADKLLTKLERACDELGEDFIDETATEEISCRETDSNGNCKSDETIRITSIKRNECRKLPVNRNGLRQLAAALKDLRDIQIDGNSAENDENTGVVVLAPVDAEEE